MSSDSGLTPSRLADIVERHYNLTISDISAMDTRRNDVYRVVTSDDSYVAKLYRRPVDLEASHRLLRWLREASFDVPLPIKSASDSQSRCVELDDRILTLSTYHSGTRFEGTEEQVRSAGETLGEIHAISRKHDSGPVGDQTESVSRYLRTLKEDGPDWLAADLLTAREHADAVRAASRSKKLLSSGELSATCWMHIHGDYIGQNILFDEDDVTAVLDWENARRDSAYAEVANATNMFAVSLGGGSPEAIDPARARPFLNAYQRANRIDISPKTLFGFVLRESVSSVVWGFQNYTESGREFYRDVGEWWVDNLQSLLRQQHAVLDVFTEVLEPQ